MKYFLYARKSTDEDDKQLLSIDAQLVELREHASKESLSVVREFVESRTAKMPGRPVFNAMMREIERGQVLSAPGSIHPHKHFNSSVYVLKKEEGGRHTPFFNGYRPQFYFRTTDVTGIIELPAGTEMVMPGDNIEMEIKLITPIAIEEGLRFAIREGGRTVGSGVVSGVID